MPLITKPNIADPDGFYQMLIDTHDGCDTKQSEALNARLILILANHIGDRDTLDEALRLARDTGDDQ